eukprot:TRINITY_DN5691_c0_g4_i2.p1 TRINITY_DN5691_c0_g4~~TRINITY_DN5691_c0_g4_i2.p1  ORF type:complete len:206 (+),score=55.10 TRINITY_DN5691_c0_g4_i2:324-941(+)
MSSPAAMRRTVYRALLRQARIADSYDITHFMARGPIMQLFASEQLQGVVDDPDMDWKDMQGSVRRLAKKLDNPSVGLEAVKLLTKICEVGGAPIVKCAVGDVVKHRVWGHVGVVVNVHDHCRMDPQWVASNVGSLDHPFIKEPWYDILLDTSHGGFVRHGALRNHYRVSQEVHHPRLATHGWAYNIDKGRYEPPQPQVPGTGAQQ